MLVVMLVLSLAGAKGLVLQGRVVRRGDCVLRRLASSAWGGGGSMRDDDDDEGYYRRSRPVQRVSYDRDSRRPWTKRPESRYGNQRRPKYRAEEKKPQIWEEYLNGIEEREFVYGIAPVLAALRHDRREIDAIFIEVNKNRKNDARISQILTLAEERQLKIHEVEKGKLSQVLKEAIHQGIAVCASPLRTQPLSQAPSHPLAGDVWLILDQIQDPQNLGAIIRSARFLGATGIILSAKNSAPLSPTCSKASAGALEEMLIHSTTNLPRLLKAAAETFRIIAADFDTSSSTPFLPFYELTDTGPEAPPTFLVLGSEGAGLRKLVKEACSFSIAVPPRRLTTSSALTSSQADDNQKHTSISANSNDDSDVSDLDSLNVSVTAALLLNHLLSPPPPPPSAALE